MKKTTVFCHRVPKIKDPVRLDTYLKKTFPQFSRQRLLSFFREKQIRIGKRLARKGEQVRGGEVLLLPEVLKIKKQKLSPNKKLKVGILYEDKHILVVSKPVGLPSCPHSFDEKKTVANFLIAHHPKLINVGDKSLEPGMIHRLDTETSGVMIVAKNDRAFKDLKKQFQDHQVKKEYLALVEGTNIHSATLKNPIGSHPKNKRKVKVYSRLKIAGVQPTLTKFHVIKKFKGVAMLRVRLVTGVRHQIRAHLAFMGHPVIGDSLYGKKGRGKRMFLHAAKLGLYHPLTRKWVEFEDPLPLQFASDGLSHLSDSAHQFLKTLKFK